MELWDVYDADRNPTGRTAVRGEKLGPDDYHLVVHVCIFGSDGRMLIQQRQSCKKSYPDYWDISCGGCAISGESSQQAAQRELFRVLFSSEEILLRRLVAGENFFFLVLDAAVQCGEIGENVLVVFAHVFSFLSSSRSMRSSTHSLSGVTGKAQFPSPIAVQVPA